MVSLSHGIQLLAATVGDWADKHPDAAKAAGFGAMGAGAGAGGWLSWRLFTGMSRLLGFGGAEAGAAGGGFGFPALGGFGVAGGVAGAPLFFYGAGEAANPTTPAGAPYRFDTAWPSQVWDMERARRAEEAWRADPEAAHARALGALSGGASTVGVSVSGEAQVDATIKVEAGSELLRIVESIKHLVTSLPLSGGTGRMDGDAAPTRGAPLGAGGIGHR
jgi:hypothetical protein